MLVICLEINVPVVIEFVIIGNAVPLQIVVAPRAAVDAVGAGLDVVVAVIPAVAQADGAGRPLRTRVPQKSAAGIERIGIEVDQRLANMPRRRLGAHAQAQL